MGKILSSVRFMLRTGEPYCRLVVLGDSLTRGVQSDGVKVICVPGVRARQLLLIAHCIVALPGVEKLIFHAGTNDLMPRLKDRPWLGSKADSGWEARAQRRLEEWGSAGFRLANLQFNSFQFLCSVSPSTHFFVSRILHRPRDQHYPIRAMQVSSFNDRFQIRLSASRPANLSFMDHRPLFQYPALFRADGLHLGLQGQAQLRQVFRLALQQNPAVLPAVVHCSDLLNGMVWH